MSISTMYPLVVDISEHQGYISPREMIEWSNNGVKVVRINTRDEVYLRTYIQPLRLYGFIVEFYIYLNYPETNTQVARTMSLASEYEVPKIWVDVEAPYDDPAAPVAALRYSVDRIRLGGFGTGLYTGGWFWEPLMAEFTNPPDFSDLDLWFSRYYADYRVQTDPGFGNFKRIDSHQFTSTPPAPFRSSLDLSYLFEEELPMDYKQKVDRLESLLAGNGIIVDGQILTGEAAMSYLAALGISVVQTTTNLNDVLTDHLTRGVARHGNG